MKNIERFLNEEISASKLAELVPNKLDLIGGFANIIDALLKPVSNGHWIVSSSECSELEVCDAKNTGRFFVAYGGLGFVVRYPESLKILKQKAEKSK